MARIWQEGFEIRRHSDHYTELYEINPSGTGFAAGRLHGFCFRGSATSTMYSFRTPVLPAHQKYTAGIAAQINAPHDTTTAPILIGFRDSGTIQMAVYVVRSTDNYFLEVWRGEKGTGTLLDTTDLILGGTGYHYYEFQAVIAPSGGTWELRQNGAVISIGTGNTRNTANSFCNQFTFQTRRTSATSGSSLFDIDDIYLNSGAGSFNNGFSGDTVVEGLLPNGAGSLTEWESESNGSPSGTPNWDQVDDTPTSGPNNDSGYVTSNTVGAIDLYAWEDLQFITGQIQGLMVVGRARIEATGNRTLGIRYKDISTAADDLDDVAAVNNATYDEKVFITELNPVTDSLFSVAQIDGMEMGPKVVS